MKGVYINIYYDGHDKFGEQCIRVYHVHTGADKKFCETMMNPHSKAQLERQRRRRRRDG